jgi:predicted XRE-type DNA-binding protein
MRNGVLDSSGHGFLDLVRGKGEKFSLEMLIMLAPRAGLHVTLKTTA